jgi:glutamate dehydrogenase/leucine dehydrogenase
MYYEGKKPWEVSCDIAIPCAIQNEIGVAEADDLIKNKCSYLIEGADQSCGEGAVEQFAHKGLIYVPSKAANVGGVAISSLEIAQNNMKVNWSESEIDTRLQNIMERTFFLCRKYGLKSDGQIDYLKGANIAAFQRVTEAMMDQGVI